MRTYSAVKIAGPVARLGFARVQIHNQRKRVPVRSLLLAARRS